MEYLIKCDVFNRLIQITRLFDDEPDNDREALSCIRLEYNNGHYYAIATNRKIASIQYLGATEQPDHVIHIRNDNEIIEMCKHETLFDSSLHIQVIPEFNMTTMTSTMTGWQYEKDPCLYVDESPLDKWREWFPDNVANQSSGVMYWLADQVEALAKSSPSGHLYFPEFIDTNEPVVVRDLLDDNWCGLFVPKPSPQGVQVNKSAEIPSWV